MDHDPFFADEGDLEAAGELVAIVGPRLAELFTYPGDSHLFTDSSLPSYDPGATALVAQTWPAVQVVFALETTAYDGFYFHDYMAPGADACARQHSGTDLPCEESNGGPAFLANAGNIAQGIQAANSHSTVS